MATAPEARSAPEAYNKAFAAARHLRDLARDAHGNLAAIQAAGPLAATDAATAETLLAMHAELLAMTHRLAELRERSAALAEAHIDANVDKLRPGFGYVIRGGHAVTRATTPAAEN